MSKHDCLQMRNRLRLSRDEEIARSPSVMLLSRAILDGRLAPNAPPESICERFPAFFQKEYEAVGAMMHACKLAADKGGAVFTVCLNASPMLLGQFDERSDMTHDHFRAEIFKLASTFRSSLSTTDRDFWLAHSLNIERMPRHDYAPGDGAVIDLYGDYITSCAVPALTRSS